MENKNTVEVKPTVVEDANLTDKAVEQVEVKSEPGLAENKEAKGAEDTKAKESEERRKTNLAFIKMRKELAALKKQKALGDTPEANKAANTNPAQETAAEIEARVRAQIAKEAAIKEFNEIKEKKEHEAMGELANDPDVASVPMGVMEVFELVESDPRLSKLNEIDPEIAIKEATKMWKSKNGIAKPHVPVAHTPASTMSGNSTSKKAILDKLMTLQPNSKEFRELYKQLNG